MRTIFGRLPSLEPRAVVPVAGRAVVTTRNANTEPQQLTRHDQSPPPPLQTDRGTARRHLISSWSGPGVLTGEAGEAGVSHLIPPCYTRPEHLLIFFLYRLCLLIIKLVWPGEWRAGDTNYVTIKFLLRR